MKNNKYFLNTMLAAVVGSVLFVCVLLRAFAPGVILPEMDIGNLVLLSLVALLLDHYLQPDAKRCYICIPVFSGLVFGLLPLAACFVSAMEALKLGAVGAGIFTLVTWLFSSIQDRLSTGPAAKAAPIFSAVGLYLAAQCFMGILL